LAATDRKWTSRRTCAAAVTLSLAPDHYIVATADCPGLQCAKFNPGIPAVIFQYGSDYLDVFRQITLVSRDHYATGLVVDHLAFHRPKNQFFIDPIIFDEACFVSINYEIWTKTSMMKH
jgi:hypothetical protein